MKRSEVKRPFKGSGARGLDGSIQCVGALEGTGTVIVETCKLTASRPGQSTLPKFRKRMRSQTLVVIAGVGESCLSGRMS